MTRKRIDDKSTEFGLWTRGGLPNQETSVKCIDARRGAKAMLVEMAHDPSPGIDTQNLDYIWFAYFDGKVMLVEEKRHGSQQRWNQTQTHSIVHEALRFACDSGYQFTKGRRVGFDTNGAPKFKPSALKYYGYHIVTFENTHPEDGWTKVDGTSVTVDQLLEFLRFEGEIHDEPN